MPYPHLFQPIDVGPITIPNRIVRSAHGTLLTGERLIAYHEARAAGGVGMSTLEATGVHANAPERHRRCTRDDVIPIYRELMARIRPYGMKMLQQIYHPGSATRPKKAATQVSSSPIPNPMVGGVPMEMTDVDDRRDGRGLRGRGPALPRGRARRRRPARVERLPHRAVPLAGQQRPHRRVRRLAREPHALPDGDPRAPSAPRSATTTASASACPTRSTSRAA